MYRFFCVFCFIVMTGLASRGSCLAPAGIGDVDYDEGSIFVYCSSLEQRLQLEKLKNQLDSKFGLWSAKRCGDLAKRIVDNYNGLLPRYADAGYDVYFLNALGDWHILKELLLRYCDSGYKVLFIPDSVRASTFKKQRGYFKGQIGWRDFSNDELLELYSFGCDSEEESIFLGTISDFYNLSVSDIKSIIAKVEESQAEIKLLSQWDMLNRFSGVRMLRVFRSASAYEGEWYGTKPDKHYDVKNIYFTYDPDYTEHIGIAKDGVIVYAEVPIQSIKYTSWVIFSDQTEHEPEICVDGRIAILEVYQPANANHKIEFSILADNYKTALAKFLNKIAPYSAKKSDHIKNNIQDIGCSN